jgi:hypothetical protein
MKISKNVLISIEASDIKNGRFINEEVTEVADGCFDQYNGKCPESLKEVILPNVTKVGNDCFIGDSFTTVSLPVLTQCGNYCFRGDSFTTVSLPVLTQCGNYCFRGGSFTTVSLPVLTQCGNDCFIGDSFTTVSLPVLTQCGNYCFRGGSFTTVSLPVLTQCGNYCFRGGSFTTVSLPVLTQCGNDCFIGDSFTTVSLPVLTQCGNDCFIGDSFTTVSLRKKEYQVKYIDGSCFVIEAERTSKGIRIYSGYNLLGMDKKKILKHNCFVASKDNFYAHGETLKKAISDLQFKVVAEKLKKEPIKADTEITINHYRLITGACEMGVKSWMQQNGIKVEKIKAKDLLPILKNTNAYGLEKFKSLITF